MTQYQRITGKVFGGNATATGNDPQIGQFGSALAGTFIGTTDPETIQSSPAWGQGWIGAVTPDTQFPPLPEMTGAMKVLSHQICGILQQGVSTWDSGTIYYTGNFCSKNGIVYVSLSDENQGNDPETDTTNWRNYGGADIDLSNLSSQGKNIANWSTNVTNCITEIPQNIKLDLTDGVLTLKAGSKVTVPNGFEEDGTTPRFDEIVIEDDLTSTWNSGAYTLALFFYPSTTEIGAYAFSANTSGNVEPTNTSSFYNTATNTVYRYNGSTKGKQLSFPLAIVTSDVNGYVSIDQTFNGIGYIGSTIWVDKGVKGLIPDGRNEDGSLKNIEFVCNKLSTRTFNDTVNMAIIFINDEGIARLSNATYSYDADTNYNKNVDVNWQALFIATLKTTSGIISYFQPKQPFRAVDYSDSSTVSGWGMPSSKYIDLTLGASGTEYTAPANGWVYLNKQSTASAQYININHSVYSFMSISSSNNQNLAALIPVRRGSFMVNYNTGGTTNHFRFIYAEGEI